MDSGGGGGGGWRTQAAQKILLHLDANLNTNPRTHAAIKIFHCSCACILLTILLGKLKRRKNEKS